MEKRRKYKLFSIIALMFAVIGLSIGFAAFQKVLSISSDATIKLPSDDNLNIEIYGAIDEYEIGKSPQYEPDLTLWSKEKAYAWHINKLNTENYASISNEDLKIYLDKVILKEPGETYHYVFLLKNNSDYGVYVYLSDKSRANFETWSTPQLCEALPETTQALVDNVCFHIQLGFDFDKEFLNGNYLLPAGKQMKFNVAVMYANVSDRADGPFSVIYEPIEIEFGAMPHVYNNLNTVEEDA